MTLDKIFYYTVVPQEEDIDRAAKPFWNGNAKFDVEAEYPALVRFYEKFEEVFSKKDKEIAIIHRQQTSDRNFLDGIFGDYNRPNQITAVHIQKNTLITVRDSDNVPFLNGGWRSYHSVRIVGNNTSIPKVVAYIESQTQFNLRKKAQETIRGEHLVILDDKGGKQ